MKILDLTPYGNDLQALVLRRKYSVSVSPVIHMLPVASVMTLLQWNGLLLKM